MTDVTADDTTTDTPDGATGDTWLTIDDCVSITKLSRSTVERGLRDERENPGTGLVHYRRRTRQGRGLRGTVRIKRVDLDNWLTDRERVEPAAAAPRSVPARRRAA